MTWVIEAAMDRLIFAYPLIVPEDGTKKDRVHIRGSFNDVNLPTRPS
jgi:hypothetical protein